MNRYDADNGFTLIEVLVAFAMLSTAVIAIYATYSDGFSSIRKSHQAILASNVVRTKLALISSDIPLRPGVVEGEVQAGVSWNVRIEPHPAPSGRLPKGGIVAYRIVATAHWRNGLAAAESSITYTTMRLGEAP